MLLGKYLLSHLLSSDNTKTTSIARKLLLILSITIPLLSGLFTILMWVIITAFGAFLVEAGFSDNIALTLKIAFLISLITVITLYIRKYFGLVLRQNNVLSPTLNSGLLLNCLREFVKGYNHLN